MLELLQSVPVGAWVVLGVFAWFSAAVVVAAVCCDFGVFPRHFDGPAISLICGLFWPFVLVYLMTLFALSRIKTKYTTCAKCGATCKEKRNG